MKVKHINQCRETGCPSDGRCKNQDLENGRLFADCTDEGEVCQDCAVLYRVVYGVPDELWNKVFGKNDGSGLLCMECFYERAKKMGMTIFWTGADREFYLPPKDSADKIQNNPQQQKDFIALAIDKFQELAGKNVEAEFLVGEIIDTLEEIAQQKSVL